MPTLNIMILDYRLANDKSEIVRENNIGNTCSSHFNIEISLKSSVERMNKHICFNSPSFQITIGLKSFRKQALPSFVDTVDETLYSIVLSA